MLDIAVGNNGGNSLTLLLGNGDGTFVYEGDFGAGDAPASIITADFNNDGKPDLAIADMTGHTVSILTNVTP